MKVPLSFDVSTRYLLTVEHGIIGWLRLRLAILLELVGYLAYYPDYRSYPGGQRMTHKEQVHQLIRSHVMNKRQTALSIAL